MPTSSLADAPPRAVDTPAVTSEDEQAVVPQVPWHPVVKVAVVGLPLLAVAVYGLHPRALVAAVTAVALVVLAAIDVEHRVLPNRILLPAIGAVLALQLAFFSDRALEWPLAGLAAAAFLALPRLVRRDAMGMGDIKLAVLLGVATGWAVFGAIVIGSLSMVPVALWMLRRDRTIRNATLPFGPFLAFGTLVVVFTS